MQTYEPIIGLEIHVQLKTKSKMFSSAPVAGSDAEPNTAIDPVVMGHPGTLPVLNREAVDQGLRLALALKCRIADETWFERKNYFYPDLPKGYQISQFARPLAVEGHLVLHHGDQRKRVSIERLHLEEDAGKNFHRGASTLVDFNRAGVPLAEIVTNPDFRSPAEAKQFLQELRLLARYLGVSDADMEKGNLRCDANISLRPEGESVLYPKTEIKNLNSFRSVERALNYEIERQRKIWERGAAPEGNETRGWDDKKGVTTTQRGKEAGADYRYFPEPDLPPLSIEQRRIVQLMGKLPELPGDKRIRFVDLYGLSHREADVLVSAGKELADFFESVVSELKQWMEDTQGDSGKSREEVWESSKQRAIKLAHSWITSELFKYLKSGETTVSTMQISAEDMAELVAMVYEAKVGSSAAQQILDAMFRTGREPHHIAEDQGLYQVSDEGEIASLIRTVVNDNPKQVEQYRAGKEAVLQFLIGKVMAASHGKANPATVAELLKRELGL